MQGIFFPLNTDTDFWYVVAMDLFLCVCQAFICKVVCVPNACVVHSAVTEQNATE